MAHPSYAIHAHVLEELVDLVAAEPGIHVRELIRRTGHSNGRVQAHLEQLVAEGRIREGRLGMHRVFATEGDPRLAALGRDEELMRLLEWVRDHEPVLQNEAIAAARQWGWPKSTTQHRLNRLEDSAFVESSRRGRERVFTML